MTAKYFYLIFLRSIKTIVRVSSIIFAIGCSSLLVYFLFSSEYYYELVPFREKSLTVTNEESVDMYSVLIVGSGKAQLRRWIENENGEIIYRYPEYDVNAFGSNKVRQSTIYVPKLRPGRYRVRAILYYQPNPITSSSVDLHLGYITINE